MSEHTVEPWIYHIDETVMKASCELSICMTLTVGHGVTESECIT